MELRDYEAGAAVGAPSAPVTPSNGNPTNGNPGTGTPATVPGAYWFYQIQEELRKIITDVGLTPDSGDLTQLSQAFALLAGAVPLAALQFPTVDTADNTLTAVGASAVAGGTVSVLADKYLSLGQEVVAGETGRMQGFKTVAYTSADLDANETYYLRGQVDGGGALLLYTTKGADSDTIPASLKGTADAASGGGFDSTVLDVLLAKVVTGNAATVPTVTNLANANNLRLQTDGDDAVTDSASSWSDLTTVTLNWARSPDISALSLIGFRLVSTSGFAGGSVTAGASEQFESIALRETTDRYTANIDYTYDDDGSGGRLKWGFSAIA